MLFFGNMYSLQNYFKFDTNHFLKKIEIPVKKINLPSILLEKKNSLEQKFLIFIILRIIFFCNASEYYLALILKDTCISCGWNVTQLLGRIAGPHKKSTKIKKVSLQN